MKIVASADWRDALPFETPVLASEAAPGDATRCATCGPGAEPLPREELWAVKHRHPNNHAGFVRFYCAEHKPAVAVAAPAAASAPAKKRAAAAPRERRAPAAPKPTPGHERPRAVCPECFMEVSAKGVCGTCGNTIPLS